MQISDIWQTIGTPQVAEIIALASAVASTVLGLRGNKEDRFKKKCFLEIIQ